MHYHREPPSNLQKLEPERISLGGSGGGRGGGSPVVFFPRQREKFQIQFLNSQEMRLTKYKCNSVLFKKMCKQENRNMETMNTLVLRRFTALLIL